MAASVFISYRRDDNPDAAGRICDRLIERFGKESVYFDIDSNAIGRDFREDIQNAVSECEALAVIIGDNWLDKDDQGRIRIENTTDFVRIEVAAALEREIPVIPVLVGNAKIPEENDLPEELKRLAYRHAVEIRAGVSFQAHVERLISGVESIFDTAARGPETPPSVWMANSPPESVNTLAELPDQETPEDTHEEESESQPKSVTDDVTKELEIDSKPNGMPSLLLAAILIFATAYAFSIGVTRDQYPLIGSSFLFVCAVLVGGCVIVYRGKMKPSTLCIVVTLAQVLPFSSGMVELEAYEVWSVQAVLVGIPSAVFSSLAALYLRSSR